MNSENSLFKVDAKDFDKAIEVPSSKSFANRALILAAQSTEEVKLSNIPMSHDVQRMLVIFEKIGLKISKTENSVSITNSFPECEIHSDSEIIIEPGDGGTTTRFIIPLLSLGKNTYIVEPEGRMRTRPVSGLIDNLISLGVDCEHSDKTWLKVKGPMSTIPEVLNVDASKTTQHATALALVLHNTHIIADGMDFSKSYWDMTLELISRYKNRENHFIVPVDFSSLSYPLALAATTGKVIVRNCKEIDTFQSDSVFISLLNQMGAKVEISDSGLMVEKPHSLNRIEHDCSNCPDLVPTLGFICSLINGTSKLMNVKVLRYKESDRLEELFHIFDYFDVNYKYHEESDFIEINGSDKKIEKFVDIKTAEDHRMVMVSYLFLRYHGGGSVNHKDCISKSFGNFYDVMG